MTQTAAGGERRPQGTPLRLVVRYAVTPARDLLRAEVARFHDVPAAEVVLSHACPRCGSSEHGRPYIVPTAAIRQPAHVSLSRAGSLSIVAITYAGPVGVDVEAVGATGFAGFDAVARHPDELREPRTEADRLWVRKEAVLKAVGLGLSVDPSRISLGEHGIAAWDSPHPPPSAVLVRDVEVPGHIAAVAVLRIDDDELSITAGPSAG